MMPLAILLMAVAAGPAGPIAEHHDGFAMWDTQYDEYNSMKMGPHRDIVGEMVQAVRRQGMKVVVTFHHMRWDYYNAGRKLCPPGIGVNDPKFAGLYGRAYDLATPEAGSWLVRRRLARPEHQPGNPIFESFREEGFNKFIEVIDNHDKWSLGYFGNRFIETPNIDSLFSGGIRFNNFMTAGRCTSSRSALMTGRYHARNGALGTGGAWGQTREEVTTIAHVFSGAGYQTAMFGKWHMGDTFFYSSSGRARAGCRYVEEG